MFFGLPCWKAGAVLVVLCAFTTGSRADVIQVDNTANTPQSFDDATFDWYAQVFTTTTSAGNFSSLTLELNATVGSTAFIDLYSSDLTTVDQLHLGIVTASSTGDQQITPVTILNNYSLAPNTSYAIVLESTTSGSIAWDFNSLDNNNVFEGNGSLGGNYNSYQGGPEWDPNYHGSYELGITTPVPEVPTTGAVMGFGALAIALGHTLRRKLRSAVFRNA